MFGGLGGYLHLFSLFVGLGLLFGVETCSCEGQVDQIFVFIYFPFQICEVCRYGSVANAKLRKGY